MVPGLSVKFRTGWDANNEDRLFYKDRTTIIGNSLGGVATSYNTLLSYLARVNYNYGNKYLLTASFRADGSSRFGEGNRFGYFPSFSAGWLMDQEEFFPLKDVFDMFKLRASWGQTGNQEIGNYSSLITFGTGNMYVLDDVLTTTLDPSRIANPDLKWETTSNAPPGIRNSYFTFLKKNFSLDCKLFKI